MCYGPIVIFKCEVGFDMSIICIMLCILGSVIWISVDVIAIHITDTVASPVLNMLMKNARVVCVRSQDSCGRVFTQNPLQQLNISSAFIMMMIAVMTLWSMGNTQQYFSKNLFLFCQNCLCSPLPSSVQLQLAITLSELYACSINAGMMGVKCSGILIW